MNKRTFTRAAGVSPPWFGRHVYADTRAIARKTADSMWADHRCHRVQRYHGGLTPPAPGRECERKANYGYSSCKFDRNIATFVNAPSTHAYSICRLDTFTTGGLRPPLLYCVANACRQKTIFAMNKRTFDRERRASARRGFPNRICKCSATNIGVWMSRAECIPRGAYAPRSWRRYNERPQEERRFLRCTNERSQERRTSARRGKRIVMAKEVRVLAAIERPQERRASARRGFPNRICKCNAMNFGASSSRAECIPRGAYAPRSWLHARHIACDMRFRFATADVLHGGLTPPAPGCTVPARRRKRQRQCVPSFSAKNDIRAAQTHIRSSAACVSRRQLKPANCLQYHRRFSVMVAGRLSSTVMGS